MEILKMECPTCKGEKEILKTVYESALDGQAVTYFLSCGHKHIKEEFVEYLKFLDFLETKHHDAQKRLLSKGENKISGKTKKPTRVILTVDHEKKTYHHTVKEQQDNGEWKIVHEH